MNKRIKNSIKILTDIQIKQSPLWGDSTDYLGTLQGDDGLIKRLPIGVGERIHPFIELFRILKYRNKYDVVITAHIITAQAFGLFRRIFRVKKPKHIILELMLDEEKNNTFWKVKQKIQKLIFSWVDIIFVSSSNEVDTYSERFKISKDRFKFLPFHTDIIMPQLYSYSNNYILSAGRTGRDYATLAKAVGGLKERVVVVSDKLNVENVVFPPNVEVLVDIPYEKYLELLYNCMLVVVPLKKLIKSTGQVAVLEAMGVGKPVIATSTVGTVDYIQSGMNGVLVPVGDVETLKRTIQCIIADNKLYEKLRVNALKSVKQNYTFDIYTSRILKAANEIVTGYS